MARSQQFLSSSEPDEIGTPRTCHGMRAAFASGHVEGTRAAANVFEAGGNVVDAALAASAVLTVCMPHATSVGGDAFFLVRDGATGQIHGLNASGMAPSRARPEVFSGGMEHRGARAPVVPGIVKGWGELHRRFGSTGWPGLLKPAIDLAQGGCAVSDALAQSILAAAPELARDEASTAMFLPDGRPLVAGAVFRQPTLAASLSAIAAQGPDSFYRGDVGSALVRTLDEQGGLMDMTDLAAFDTVWVDPLHATYRGHDVYAMPPNSYGVLMLMQLRALEALPRRLLRGGDRERMLWQIRAMRAVMQNALAEIGDPAFMRVTAADLLSDGRNHAVRECLQRELAGASTMPSGGTACVTVADAMGNAVCIVQSIFNPFGAHLLDPRTGLVLNNRMSGFDHRPGGVNAVAGRKRCAHTLNPVMVAHDGQLRLVYASPGGVSQTITGTQILVNLIDRNLGLADAIGAPRWATDRHGGILLEPQGRADVMAALLAAGLPARQEKNAYLFGSATAVLCSADGTLSAVGDARRQAASLAY